MTEQTESPIQIPSFEGRALEVDGIVSRVGIADGASFVGVLHVNRIFESKDDHPYPACPMCFGVINSWEESMRWTKEQPILRFTRFGLEVSHHGGQVPG